MMVYVVHNLCTVVRNVESSAKLQVRLVTTTNTEHRRRKRTLTATQPEWRGQHRRPHKLLPGEPNSSQHSRNSKSSKGDVQVVVERATP
mmetsp:Transcript_29388/g.90071  ORF Transcript_29388/g.90071 Transcript_29388/m.90071 type:complete len:89 (+) Transcript_29388:236-502(+)|eukprot:scaffold177169_cov31-Tisochrysis_lutea.AAC.2